MRRLELALRLIGVGWYVGVCIVLGVLGGRWLDSKLNSHLFTIAGLLLGIVLAFYGVYRMIVPIINQKWNKGKR